MFCPGRNRVSRSLVRACPDRVAAATGSSIAWPPTGSRRRRRSSRRRRRRSAPARSARRRDLRVDDRLDRRRPRSRRGHRRGLDHLGLHCLGLDRGRLVREGRLDGRLLADPDDRLGRLSGGLGDVAGQECEAGCGVELLDRLVRRSRRSRWRDSRCRSPAGPRSRAPRRCAASAAAVRSTSGHASSSIGTDSAGWISGNGAGRMSCGRGSARRSGSVLRPCSSSCRTCTGGRSCRS